MTALSDPSCGNEVDEIEKARPSEHVDRVMLRPLFATLIAAAMLFAPFAMESAMAATPTNRHAQNDHCGGQPAQDQDSKSADKPCCPAMCMALAVEPASVVEPIEFRRTAERPGLAASPHSYLAKLPTPPPRRT